MNREVATRAVLAAVAGAAGALLIYVAFRALGNVTLSGPIGIFSPITPADHLFVLVQLLLIFLGYLAAVGIGGALPARALGAGWGLSFLSGAIALPAAYVVAIIFMAVIPGEPPQEIALVLLLNAALALIIATKADRWAAITFMFAAAGLTPIVFVLTAQYGVYAGLIAWPILSSVVALAPVVRRPRSVG